MLISDGTIRGKIEPISAVIRQEINGEYSCDVEIALSDELAGYFDIDAIVYLDDANGSVQQFRLERPEKTLDSLRAFGWHISQDLAHDMILNDAWITQTGSAVLPDLLQAGISETRFTGTSDITSENSLRIVRKSVLNALIGDDDNTFLNRWGGEIERDNFTVNMKQRLGADRGYRIAYKKNLTGIEIIDDASTIVNRIVPTFLNASDAAVLLPETYIDSDRIEDTAVPHVRSIHYGDIKVGEEVDGVVPYPTLASAYSEVRGRVASLYDAGIDRPALTVDIEFVQLRNTLEYADFAMLETVLLGDTIRADYEDYTVTNRVVAYEWDALLKRYNKITLGTVRPSVDAMTASIATQVAESVDATVRERVVSSIVTALVKMNEHINGAMGYYSTTVTNADGSRYSYLHDEPTLEDSLFISYVPEPGSYVWTNTGWNDGSPSWNYGYTQDGNAVFRLLSTVGLNADWINAGTVNAERVAIGSGTTFASGYNPTLITIGARNYIPNSKLTANKTGWTNWYDTTSHIAAGLVAQCTVTTAGEAFGVCTPEFTIEAGVEYTLSFDVSSRYYTSTLDYNWIVNSVDGGQRLGNVSVVAGSGDYNRRTIRFTADNSGTVYILIGKLREGTQPTEGFRIRNVKLEKGNKATDWSPAPEDTDTSIASVYDGVAQKLGYANYATMVAEATAGNTVISGGMINTLLLTADNIVTGKLLSADGKTWFDLDAPEIVQTATISGKAVRVEMSPTNPFKLSIDGEDWMYVTDNTGYSGPNILVTSRYDINEDGAVNYEDLEIVTKYMLHKDIEPGTAWPAGYPSFDRMDVNGDGNVNSMDMHIIWQHSGLNDKIVLGSNEFSIDTYGKLFMSFNYGETTYPVPELHCRTSAATTSATKWIKIATVTLSSQYQYKTIKMEVIGRCSTGGLPYCASVLLSVLQQTAKGTDPVGSVRISDVAALSTTSVKAVVTEANATSGSTVELYVQSVAAYKDIATRVLSDMGAGGVSYSLGSWQAALPAGTQLTTTQID